MAPYPSVLAVEVPAAWIWRSYFLWRMLGAYPIIAPFADNVELFMRTYIAASLAIAKQREIVLLTDDRLLADIDDRAILKLGEAGYSFTQLDDSQ